MGNFAELRKPYEFLVRWNEEGAIQGASVSWLNTVTKDGIVVNRAVDGPEPIGENGFPLADILSQIQIDALAELSRLTAENAMLKELKNYQEPVAIKSITMRQAKLALLYKGLLSKVEGAINATDDEATKIEWQTATVIDYDNALVNSLCEMLGLDKDELFNFASTL